jgi:hypothetical protein
MNFLTTLTQISRNALLLIILFLSTSTFGQVYQRDTISMEPGRTHDVFYSLKTGSETSVIRDNWDIEFSTAVMDVTIRTNGANGVKLYTYPNAGLDGWNNIDTTGLHMWPVLYNSDIDWEMGAFNKNSTGSDFDYGWGIYNGVSHKIVGDSIFVMQLPDMSFKQVWIVLKDPTFAGQNKYTFKYANLDGSDEHEVVVPCNDYASKNFIAYSISNNELVDREPASKDWDLEFCKYITFYGGQAWYGVTGLLQNYNVQAASYPGVDTAFVDFEISALDSTNISTIGNYWYGLDGMPPTYVLEDSLVYFVSDQESSIWKVVFEYYDSNLGEIGFKKMLLEDHASISELEGDTSGNIAIQPNPVKDIAHLLFNADESGAASISVFSMTGAKVFEQSINYSRGLNNHRVNVSDLPVGVYVVMLKAGETILKNKMVKQ